MPPVVWVPTPSGYRSVDRAQDPTGWLAAVDADVPVVTQVDDGATPTGEIGLVATSSSSEPILVRALVEAARLRDGTRVLEIGTGTGWTAGLLAQQLGSDNVVTIEVDPSVAAGARSALAAVGLAPLVLVTDGTFGHAVGGPYDRVLATCAVRQVPMPWIRQVRTGGLIVTPWGTDYHNGMLARLTKLADGRAEGAFIDEPMAFMNLRSQRRRDCPWELDGPGIADVTSCALRSDDVYEMLAPPGAFAVGLLVPACHKIVDEHELTVRLHDPDSSSWATCTVRPGVAEQVVAQYGRLSLWDEVVAARAWWITTGRPRPNRFGLTVTADGQRIWFECPGRVPGT